jgi:hypothetical protein
MSARDKALTGKGARHQPRHARVTRRFRRFWASFEDLSADVVLLGTTESTIGPAITMTEQTP